MVLEGENLVTSAKSTGLGLSELATVFDNRKPDAVVTIADRYETLATAVAASYMNIPVVHVQGGEVTGSIDEKVRHAVTKLSNLHLVSTERRRERVMRLGESPSPPCSSPAARRSTSPPRWRRSPALDFDPFEKYGGVGPKADLSRGYLVVMQHPVTTEYDEARAAGRRDAVRRDGAGLPVLWFWPNVDAGLRRHVEGHPRVPRAREARATSTCSGTCSPRTSCACWSTATAIVGNSSVAIRECSFLGVPAVNIGSRQQGRERGAQRDRRRSRPRRPSPPASAST